jgi:hypothetical protein
MLQMLSNGSSVKDVVSELSRIVNRQKGGRPIFPIIKEVRNDFEDFQISLIQAYLVR